MKLYENTICALLTIGICGLCVEFNNTIADTIYKLTCVALLGTAAYLTHRWGREGKITNIDKYL